MQSRTSPNSLALAFVALASPATLDVLEGRLQLEHLRWQAADPGQGARFVLTLPGRDG